CPAFSFSREIKSRIGGHHARDSSQSLLVHLKRGQQQSRICRPLGIHLKVSYDLVFRFLDLDQHAKLVGLARFPFANNFRVRFEHAHDLSWRLRVSSENPHPRLFHYLPNSPHPWSPAIAPDPRLECADDAATASLRPVLSAPDLLLFASS